MIKNEGKTDRSIRIIFGLILILLAFILLTGTLKLLGIFFGFVLVITGITGFCGIYKLFGISTCPIGERQE